MRSGITVRSSLVVESQHRDGIVVLRPVGVLDVATYARLRDVLLKHAADHPTALVVDLDDLVVPQPSALSLFTAVWQRISTWPGVPLLLSAAREPLTGALHAAAVSRFVPTFRSVPDAVAAVADAPPRRRDRLPLAARPRQARSARVWTRAVLLGWELPLRGQAGIDFLDDAVLVASELVENSVRHTGSPRSLRVEWHARGLSVAVSDDDPRPPVLVAPEDATSFGGRGLAMVATLALAGGHHVRPGAGKVVWAVLALPG